MSTESGMVTMRTINTNEVLQMRSIFNATMGDSCNIISYSTSGSNSYGEVTSASSSASSVCGFHNHGGVIRKSGQLITVEYDATLRLPYNTTIANNSHISITEKSGSAITPIEFELFSPVKIGMDGLRLELKRVVT